MNIILIICFVAAVISWCAGIEVKRLRHKRRVERNYQEYKTKAKK